MRFEGGLPSPVAAMLTVSIPRSVSMTTILIINAISSLVAGAGLGALAIRRGRRIRRSIRLAPVYANDGGRRRRLR
jgi:hypothetical protein